MLQLLLHVMSGAFININNSVQQLNSTQPEKDSCSASKNVFTFSFFKVWLSYITHPSPSFCSAAAAGYCAAESHAGSGGLHSEVCPERSVEPDGRAARRRSKFHRVPGPGAVRGGAGGA